MSKRFCGESFCGRPDAIRELLKELCDEENSAENGSENEEFLEMENNVYTDRDMEENDNFSVDRNKEGKIAEEYYLLQGDNNNLKCDLRTENCNVSDKSDWIEQVPKFFESCNKSIIYPGKIQLSGKDKSKWSSVPKASNTRTKT